MLKENPNQVSIISKSSMATILSQSLQSLGYTVRKFPTYAEYVSTEQARERATLIELDLDALLGKDSSHIFEFLGTGGFRTHIILLYCAANYLRPENLSSVLIGYPVPLCYLPAPMDIRLLSKILCEKENDFVQKHDLRVAAVLMEFFKQLTMLRHSLRNCMVGINDDLRILRYNPAAISDFNEIIPRETDGRLRPECLANQYRKEVERLIGFLPNHLSTLVKERHNGVMALTKNLKEGLLQLIAEKGDVVLLSSQILDTETEFEKYTKSFKDFLEQTTKGIIRNHE